MPPLALGLLAILAAGFLPGFLCGLALMIMVYFVAKRDGLPREVKAGLREMLKAAVDALPPLFMPVTTWPECSM